VKLLANKKHRLPIVLALAAVYLFWGSSYLGIRIAIETWPPFLMAGCRFFGTGLILYIWECRRGVPKLAAGQWREATITGVLLMVIGSGGVVYAAKWVPSGMIALLLSLTPVWMVLLDWCWGNRIRPRKRVFCGLALGFLGAGLLVMPGKFAGGEHVNLFGAVILWVASIGWAFGSLHVRRSPLPVRQILATGMQMMVGGGVLLGIAAVTGELNQLGTIHFSLRSTMAMVYLMLFSTLITFCSYAYLLRMTSMAVASTYSYVCPLIAVVLGVMLGGEHLALRMAVAGIASLAGVAVIILSPVPRSVDPIEPV